MLPKSFQEVITVASKTEYSVQLVFGLCFHSSTAKNVDHEEFWLAFLACLLLFRDLFSFRISCLIACHTAPCANVSCPKKWERQKRREEKRSKENSGCREDERSEDKKSYKDDKKKGKREISTASLNRRSLCKILAP